MQGTVVAIHIAQKAGGEMTTLTEAELVAGVGIVGDRYFDEKDKSSEQELTLVAVEQIEQFNAAFGLGLEPADTRRNIVTRGVSLNDLVGVEFMLGSVRVEGLELCEPCKYLADSLMARERTGDLTPSEIIAGLAHRAGLRARILDGGAVRAGDPVRRPAPLPR